MHQFICLACCAAVAYAPRFHDPPPTMPPPSDLVRVYEFENVHDPQVKAYFTTPILTDPKHKDHFKPSPKAIFCLLKPGATSAYTSPIPFGAIFFTPDFQSVQCQDALDPGVSMLGRGWGIGDRTPNLVRLWIARRITGGAYKLVVAGSLIPISGYFVKECGGMSVLPPQYCT